MKTYITSDLHFGHRRINIYCPKTRGHWDTQADPSVMNADMISMWNQVVNADDLVYILGDVAFMPAVDTVNILNQLNGTKILIEGNHDHKNLRDRAFRSCFKEIHKYLEIVYNNTQIIMCHYPMYDHNGAGRGSLMLHGHRHGNPHGIPGRIKDVGFDATGKIVMNLDDVVVELKQIKPMEHHHPI